MATAGSAERRGRPAKYGTVAGCGSTSSPPEREPEQCAGRRPSGCPPPAPTACRLRRTQRRPGSGERLRRSEPGRGSCAAGKRDRHPREECFVSPAIVTKCCDSSSPPTGKHKPGTEEREEAKRRTCRDKDVPGVLSDSENEEPFSRRIRNISAFIRKTKNSVAVSSGAQRSQSCSEPVEDRRWKTKVVTQPAIMDRVGVSHSYAAGILLSSENSRSVSAPITADRRLAWRAVVSSTAAATAPPHPERSISPESNDSISEELNHFKPIVCSPCTPPKRLPDGRLLEPAVVKSTPRNLTRGLQKATSYEASPAVLQKWRQIELDRQSLKTNSRATLTSPVNEGGRDGLRAANKRRLLFEPLAADAGSFQKHAVKIRVPAIRYSSEAGLRGSSDLRPAVGAPEPAGGGLLFSQKQSFSPYTKNSNFQSCKLVPKASPSPRKESDSSLHNQALSRRGTKREQKTKHLDSERDAEPKKSRSLTQEAFDERYVRQIQQERQDRAVALRLQRQFDRENQADDRRRSPERYFLRSWMSNQNLRLRRGLRRSRRINKKH
ncbi:E3 ubiquitin-protein ligase RNF169 [Pungitius pungitius]|uniref:E3 ubiquitin-protein ligase RNF169 n=1 Tax=Pungitius pungitius TaxID=134920 RepID=UPI0018890F7C